MNNPFQNMNYPQNFINRQNLHTNALKPPQKVRQNNSQKRQTPIPFITQLPYHLPGPIQQHQSSPNGYMRGQQPFHPQMPSNQIFDYVQKLQTVVGQMQFTCKEMYEWILRYHMALEQQTLQKNYLRALLQESCVERTKIIQAYQNLYLMSLNNQLKNKNQPVVPENISILQNKSQNKEEKKLDISLQKSIEKQVKPLKSVQKKNISEQKPRKKQVQNIQKQKIKKPIISKEQSEEKKVFSNEDLSVKKQPEQYKYYNRSFQNRGELKQYKKKLRDKFQKDLAQQIIPAKSKRARKSFQYIQLDNAPKALKKLRQQYLAKKSQYLNEKHKNEIQQQNHSNEEKKKPQTIQMLEQDQKIKFQNQDLYKKTVDSKNSQKKNKNLNKQFLSDGQESDIYRDKNKERRLHNSILKPLFQTNKKQLQDEQKIELQNHQKIEIKKEIQNNNQIVCQKDSQNEESKFQEQQRAQNSIESNSESQRKEKQQGQKHQQILENHSHVSDHQDIQDDIQGPIKTIEEKVQHESDKQQDQRIKADQQKDIQISKQLKDKSIVSQHQQDSSTHNLKKTNHQGHNYKQDFDIKNNQKPHQNLKQSEKSQQNQANLNQQRQKPTQIRTIKLIKRYSDSSSSSSSQQEPQKQSSKHPDIVKLPLINFNPSQQQQNQANLNEQRQKPIQIRRIKIIKRQPDSSSSSSSSSQQEPSKQSSSYGSPSHYQDELINSSIYDQILQKRNIVHYDIEQTEHRQKKQKKKKNLKVKIPCFKNQPFLIIKNYRQYQKLNNYGVTFQGVFQNQKITRNNFEKEKYDQVFSYNLSKQKRKDRKARGKYKKCKQINQQDAQEQPESSIQNSESIQHEFSESEDHGVKYTEGSYKL